MTALNCNIFVQLFDWIIIPFYTILCSFKRIKKTRLNKSRLFMHWQLFYQCKMAAPDRLELTTLRLTAACSTYWAKGQCRILHLYKIRFFGCSNNLSSRAVSSRVFSALVSLTSVFGMRTGGTSPLTSPQWYIYEYSLEHIVFLGIYIIYLFSSVVNFFTRQIYNCIDLFLTFLYF